MALNNYSSLLMRGAYGAVPDPDYGPKDDPYARLREDPLAPPAPPQMEPSPEALAFLQEQQHMPPAQEQQGFLQRFQQTPGMGLGLMQLGAGLASGKDWGEGIGRGFSGMADTLQKQSMIEEDRAYKQAMLAARALGKSKQSVGSLYQFTLEDGTKVNGFMRMGADGNPQAVDGRGNILSPVSVERVATEKDPGGMKSKMFVDQGQKIFQDPSSPTSWSTAAGKPWEPKDPVPYDENPTQDKAPPRPGGIRLTDKDGKDLGSFQQGILPGTQIWGVLDPRINGGKPTSLEQLASMGIASRQETGGERGKAMSDFTNLVKYQKDARGNEIAVHSLGRLREDIANSPDGGMRYLQRLAGQVQTIFGRGMDINEMRQHIMAGDKEASSIVGLLRQEIVGGGTMTEQDAIRVLDAIGGDTNGLTWNKKVALDALDEIISRKKLSYTDAQRAYNSAAESLNLDTRYEPQYPEGIAGGTTSTYKTPAGQASPAAPNEAPAAPKRTRRWNPATGSFEDI